MKSSVTLLKDLQSWNIPCTDTVFAIAPKVAVVRAEQPLNNHDALDTFAIDPRVAVVRAEQLLKALSMAVTLERSGSVTVARAVHSRAKELIMEASPRFAKSGSSVRNRLRAKHQLISAGR